MHKQNCSLGTVGGIEIPHFARLLNAETADAERRYQNRCIVGGSSGITGLIYVEITLAAAGYDNIDSRALQLHITECYLSTAQQSAEINRPVETVEREKRVTPLGKPIGLTTVFAAESLRYHRQGIYPETEYRERGIECKLHAPDRYVGIHGLVCKMLYKRSQASWMKNLHSADHSCGNRKEYGHHNHGDCEKYVS